ncbi:phage major capsid protein [Rhodococcus ruber]|uniref:phage major capsid protein n=1 Tax=Rhodococcus ruber TaxID=1830 RepID=UPI001785DA49|nr:phage major capsid protein [Rhodococcus ruber]MBD8054132.1 phage major capsid protein [Rhodococcus ruber]WKK13029.1 phage major capsid protein [Rhodococcus ruber]
MNLRDQLKAKLARAKELRAAADSRDLTADELAEVDTLAGEIKTLNERIAKSDAAAATLAGVRNASTDEGDDMEGGSTEGYAAGLLGSGFVKTVALKMRNPYASGDLTDAPRGAKSLLPSGEIATGVPLQSASPIAGGRVASTLLDILTVVKNPAPRFAYIRQVARSMQAAPVAQGALKPTSTTTLERIEDDLSVIAHLSEPIDKYWLDDLASLEQFIKAELLFGLVRALEAQVLTGTGTGVNLTGLLTTSGTQAQPYVADPEGTGWLTSARGAITKLEAEGYEPLAYVVAAADWERQELSRNTSGWLDLHGSPVQAVERRLWGVPVVVNQTITAGTAVLLGKDATALQTDKLGVQVRWSENVGEDFERNQLRARVEGRFGLAVYRPRAVVVIDTAA